MSPDAGAETYVGAGAGPDPAPAIVPPPADPPSERSDDSGGPRRSRRRFLLAGGVAAALLIAGGVTVSRRSGDDSGDDDPASATAGATTAKVERRTLEEHEELDGTLGYGDSSSVNLAAEGTITALPAIGSIVDRGQTLVEVNGVAIPLLFGDRPFWRDLASGIDDGADVQELEANLVALGIVSESELTVDSKWTSSTTAAVKKWQKARGVEQTGSIGPNSVVVLPGAVRVAEHPTPVGGQASGEVLKVTGSTRLISIDLEATRQRLVQVGQKVVVVLPDNSETAGTIASVGSVAVAGETDEQTGEAGDPTIEVIVSLDDPAASGTVDQAPVTVNVVTSAAADVLAVPVQALLALAEGGYAVEVVRGSTTELVAVELGAFADGWVEITGEVAEGDEVVIPGE